MHPPSHKAYIRHESRDYATSGVTGLMDMPIDPDKPRTAHPADVLSKWSWSPFEGETFSNAIVGTPVDGQRAWHGTVVDDGARGRRGRRSTAGASGYGVEP